MQIVCHGSSSRQMRGEVFLEALNRVSHADDKLRTYSLFERRVHAKAGKGLAPACCVAE
jgi:hypothetical protein